jgi:lipoprotein NlpD
VAPAPQPVPSQLPAGATPAPRPLPPPPSIPGGWQWPSAGKLVLGYANSAQPHKGIDIAGNTGDPVVAAKGGTVVYAGNGVRGYGNLLIVKHDALFLSAYAHNSKLLVREGDVVKGGQQIAEMGDSGTDRTKLHFEVRKQGNPVDPLQVLPRR